MTIWVRLRPRHISFDGAPVSELSRLSRNSAKQPRVLEFLLAHRALVLTTNYLLSVDTVGVCARPLLKSDS